MWTGASELSRTLATQVSRRKFTLSTWYKSNNKGTMPFCAGISSGKQTFLWAGTSTGQLFIQNSPGGSDEAETPNVMSWPLNTWIHVVLSVDLDASGVSRVRWWLDGMPVASTTASGDAPLVSDLFIGQSGVKHTLGNKWLGGFDWSGKLAETYVIFGHALDASAFVTTENGQLKSIAYTGPVTPESAYFDYAGMMPGRNRLAGNPDWTAQAMTSDTVDLPY